MEGSGFMLFRHNKECYQFIKEYVTSDGKVKRVCVNKKENTASSRMRARRELEQKIKSEKGRCI